jgi:FkbM family methyltransferase
MRWLQALARRTADLVGREALPIRLLRPAYEAVLALSRDGIPWAINGVPCRIDPRQRQRMSRDYDRPVAEFLRPRVRPGAVCLDVGANVGVYVLQFAAWAGPTGRVVAFEPNPEACAVLARHVRYNRLDERVRFESLAVGAAPGKAILHAAGADGMSRLIEPNAALAGRTRPLEVEVITLDHYCRAHGLRPDWLLLDVEGYEVAALQGASHLFRDRPELDAVVELHPDVWEASGTSRQEAERLLRDLGRRPVPLTGQADPLAEHGTVYLAREGA